MSKIMSKITNCVRSYLFNLCVCAFFMAPMWSILAIAFLFCPISSVLLSCELNFLLLIANIIILLLAPLFLINAENERRKKQIKQIRVEEV
jgi:hypothetical protein